jgi:hypothetical protein
VNDYRKIREKLAEAKKFEPASPPKDSNRSPRTDASDQSSDGCMDTVVIRDYDDGDAFNTTIIHRDGDDNENDHGDAWSTTVIHHDADSVPPSPKSNLSSVPTDRSIHDLDKEVSQLRSEFSEFKSFVHQELLELKQLLGSCISEIRELKPKTD